MHLAVLVHGPYNCVLKVTWPFVGTDHTARLYVDKDVCAGAHVKRVDDVPGQSLAVRKACAGVITG